MCAPLLGSGLGGQLASTDLGTPGLVPAGLDVDVVVVRNPLPAPPDRDAQAGREHALGGPERRSGLRAFDPAGLDLAPIETVDRARRMTEVGSVSGGRPLDEPAVPPEVAGALGTAAVLVGLGTHLLDATVAYVSEREQFGQPVGGFQAVKHHLADAAKDLAFARPIVWRAAYGLDAGDAGAARDVSAAKALASDAASLAADVALQCHGAIGYTVEYDLHLWLKRVWALARAWGDAAHHRRLVADALGL